MKTGMNAPLKYLLQDDAANDACVFYARRDFTAWLDDDTCSPSFKREGCILYHLLGKGIMHAFNHTHFPKDISIHNFSTPLALSIWSGYVEIKTPAYEQYNDSVKFEVVQPWLSR